MPLPTVPAGPKFAFYVVFATVLWFAVNAGFCFSQGR
jgi:hypothetical protein